MIKATELRKGNLFLHKGKAIEVDGIDEDDYILVYNSFYDDCVEHIKEADAEPIHITTEWLERCGFEYNKDGDTWFKEGMNEFITLHYEGFAVYESVKKLIIKSIHQLQNLFFALTGEELTIKN